MKLTWLRVENCRSIVQFDNNLSETINLLVGRNNCGKSTLLRAIASFNPNLCNVKSLMREGESGVRVTAKISLDASEEIVLTKAGNHTVKALGDGVTLVDKEGSVFKELHHWPQGLYWNETHFCPIWSERKSVAFSEDVGTQSTNLVSSGWTYLSGLVVHALTGVDDDHRTRFLYWCRRIGGVEPTMVPNSGLQVGRRLAETTITLDKLGGGVPHIFGFVATLLRARNKMILIEEPEIDLNPHALRNLCALIRERSAENQFFISTHSNIIVRELGGEGNKVFHFELDSEPEIPVCHITEVTTREQSMALLLDLGYDASDMMLYKGFLILEESSVEQMIKDVLIPWFVPELVGKLKTVSAGGVDNLEASLYSLSSLFVFVHLQEIYINRAWVMADGDSKGKKVVGELKKHFSDPKKPDHLRWPETAFKCLLKENFEEYLPEAFQPQFYTAKGEKKHWKERKGLWDGVFKAILEDKDVYEPIIRASCAEIISELEVISGQLV